MSELQLPAAAPAITHARYAALARRAKLLSLLEGVDAWRGEGSACC